MLLAALHFWEGSTSTFKLCCGMLTPTLFDIASITSLRPTGEMFDLFYNTNNIIGFNSKRDSFTNFIIDHFDGATLEVSCEENVSFLSLWISHFIFYSSSLQVEKSFVTLSNQLHARRKCLP